MKTESSSDITMSTGVLGELTLSPSDIVEAYGGIRGLSVGLVADEVWLSSGPRSSRA